MNTQPKKKWTTPRFYDDEASGNENFSSSTTTYWGTNSHNSLIYACMHVQKHFGIWTPLKSTWLNRPTLSDLSKNENNNHHVFSNDCIESIYPSPIFQNNNHACCYTLVLCVCNAFLVLSVVASNIMTKRWWWEMRIHHERAGRAGRCGVISNNNNHN